MMSATVTVIDLALTIVVLGTMLIALGVLVDVSKWCRSATAAPFVPTA